MENKPRLLSSSSPLFGNSDRPTNHRKYCLPSSADTNVVGSRADSVIPSGLLVWDSHLSWVLRDK